MPPEQPQGVDPRGMSDPGIFGTGILHWVTLGIMVLIFLAALYLLFRTYRRTKRRQLGKEQPEIRSTDT